jgi:hypothetical protein
VKGECKKSEERKESGRRVSVKRQKREGGERERRAKGVGEEE